MASCISGEHSPRRENERFMTSAGFWFGVEPETSPPEDQVMAAEMSATVPPAQLIALTGKTFALGAKPSED
jgi:hypothetical protein